MTTTTDQDERHTKIIEGEVFSDAVGGGILSLSFLAGLDPRMRLIVIDNKGEHLVYHANNYPPPPPGIVAALDLLRSHMDDERERREAKEAALALDKAKVKRDRSRS
jgi:hypothetical protein